MGPQASVNLKISSLSFKCLEYMEGNDSQLFFNPIEILKHIEEMHEKKFKF
jgi:hypothetical protein